MRRSPLRTTFIVPLAAALLLAACGGGTSEANKAEPVAAVGLSEALATTAAASGYRISQSTGQVISVAPLGLNTRTELDEARPSVIAEGSGDNSHLRIDLSSVLGPLLGDDVPDLGFEIWLTSDRMVVDTTDYAALTDANPSANLGPLSPGVAYIDLNAVRDDQPDLLAAIVGQGVPDLAVMAERLPKALKQVQQDATTVTGTARYTDLLTAMGTDVAVTARSAAAGIALNLDVDPDDLTDFYVDFYRTTDAEVTLELGDEGIRSMRYELDLSGLFPSIIENAESLGIAIPADQVQSARDAFADTIWTLESFMRFESVEHLELTPVPDTSDDRTQQWLAFLTKGGF